MPLSTFLDGTTPSQLRGLQWLSLSDLGRVGSGTVISDGGGGGTTTWADGGTIACRVDPLGGGVGRPDRRTFHTSGHGPSGRGRLREQPVHVDRRRDVRGDGDAYAHGRRAPGFRGYPDFLKRGRAGPPLGGSVFALLRHAAGSVESGLATRKPPTEGVTHDLPQLRSGDDRWWSERLHLPYSAMREQLVRQAQRGRVGQEAPDG
jgi:hypothetical protein